MVLHPFRRQKGIPPRERSYYYIFIYPHSHFGGAAPGRVGEHTPAK